MTKNTRFYFFVKLLIQSIVILVLINFIRSMLIDYFFTYGDYFNLVFWILNTVKILAIISIILILIYFVYVGGNYLSSSFYRESGIPVHEALFHGYTDLAYVYSRLNKFGTKCVYDTKSKSIMIEKNNKVYIIIVRDIFGKLEANPQNDSWYIVSKKRRHFGKIKYMKRKKVTNPLNEYSPFIITEKGKEITKLVCLTGLRTNTFNHDQIHTVYEIEGIINN